MKDWLRLRQIALVAEDLETASDNMAAVLGLQVCLHDPRVGVFGLRNSLFVVGTNFIEIVSPKEEGTAAGRFFKNFEGRGGYMAIFDCPNPDERAKHANAIGVRTAYTIDRPFYTARQLHPRDARATMVEFDRSIGGDEPEGFYSPAGEGWQTHIDRSVTRDLIGIEVASRTPDDIARHWGAILQRPVTSADGKSRVEVDNVFIDFLFEDCPREYLKSAVLSVVDRGRMLAQAAKRGVPHGTDFVTLSGVDFKLV